MKQLTLEINERQEEEELQVNVNVIQEHFHIFICSVVLVTTHKK